MGKSTLISTISTRFFQILGLFGVSTFGRSSSPRTEDGDSSDDGFDDLFVANTSIISILMLSRTLYTQMEFVERQTLKEKPGRLFQQIPDALVHMPSLEILHNIEFTNIFIDAKGDYVSSHAIVMDAEMTLEVGTRLYIALEVQSRKRGFSNHNMYSLGIVFSK
ncbi:hypothetical protein BD779DRAFT_1242776 [Infundibulicybe gibba]|nr:hypothetical protein BD779DRAFT_1242776 [Infundibulicybe gibba]